MTTFSAQDPRFEARVRASFACQQVMKTIGATLTRVSAGDVEIELPFRQDLTQQHGFLHAGIVTTIADSACGYAALSLMPPEASVLTVEYKVNLLSPARGMLMIARGRVLRPGRSLTVCSADVVALIDGKHKPVAAMLATMIAVNERPDLPHGM
jgi:uncharacterized protein (TIGR00369 family)